MLSDSIYTFELMTCRNPNRPLGHVCMWWALGMQHRWPVVRLCAVWIICFGISVMLFGVEIRLSMSDDRSMHTGVRDFHIRIWLVARYRIQMSLDHFGSPTIFFLLSASCCGRCISSEILTQLLYVFIYRT